MIESSIKKLEKNLSQEVWKPIQGWVNLYEVSNKGNVRRVGKTKVLKPDVNRDGKYRFVVLSKNNKRHQRQLSRLVAEAFCKKPNTNERLVVDHIDNDPHNDKSCNLQWITQSENIKRAYDQGRKKRNRGSKNGMSKLSVEDVLKIRSYSRHQKSSREIAKMFNLSRQHVDDIRNRKRWDHV